MGAFVTSILACPICTSTGENTQCNRNGSTLHKQLVLWIKAWLSEQGSKYRIQASPRTKCLHLLSVSAASHEPEDYNGQSQMLASITLCYGTHTRRVYVDNRCSVPGGEVQGRLKAALVSTGIVQMLYGSYADTSTQSKNYKHAWQNYGTFCGKSTLPNTSTKTLFVPSTCHSRPYL